MAESSGHDWHAYWYRVVYGVYLQYVTVSSHSNCPSPYATPWSSRSLVSGASFPRGARAHAARTRTSVQTVAQLCCDPAVAPFRYFTYASQLRSLCLLPRQQPRSQMHEEPAAVAARDPHVVRQEVHIQPAHSPEWQRDLERLPSEAATDRELK